MGRCSRTLKRGSRDAVDGRPTVFCTARAKVSDITCRCHLWQRNNQSNFHFESRFRLAPASGGLQTRSSSSVLSPRGFSRPRNGPVLPRVGIKHPKLMVFQPSSQTLTPLPPYLVTEICSALRAAYPAGDGSVAILFSMLPNCQTAAASDDSPPAATSSARVLDQTSAGFHQALLQTGQRPGADSRRQHQPPL
jgi:hypothetical protein